MRILLSFLLVFTVLVAPAQSDELSDMISPMSHFANFEDPRIISEIRPIYVYHAFEDDFVTGGGNVQAYAVQARFAVTDDFAIIATKDGYLDFNPDANLPEDEGFADIGLGVKYALFQDREAGQIVTAGLRYEIPLGDEEVLQGEGDGEFNPFVSAAMAVGDMNVMVGSGFRIRVDSADSTFFDFDIHADYQFGSFYPFVEFGLIHVVSAGNRLPLEAEGHDLFNFGASEADGNTLITAAGGARYRITEDVDFGAKYLVPISSGSESDVTDFRVMTDLIFRFDI